MRAQMVTLHKFCDGMTMAKLKQMKRILVTALAGMVGLLAPSGLSRAQAPMTMPSTPMTGSQGQKSQSPSPSAIYAPSDMAVVSSGSPDAHRSRGGQGILRLFSGSAETGRASAEGEPNLPRLCFQPGIGWTLIPAGSIENTDPKKDNESELGGNPGNLTHRRISSGKHREAENCPTMLQLQGGSQGTNSDSSAEYTDLDFMKPLFSSGADLSRYNIFQTLLGDHSGSGAGDSAGYKSAFDLRARLKGGKNLNTGEQTYSPNELKELRNRAYVSPVKLRRLSRNVQNVETRIELRQLSTEVEKRNTSRRRGKDQNSIASERNSAGDKHKNSRDLLAKKAECEKKANASKSKACSLFKQGR